MKRNAAVILIGMCLLCVGTPKPASAQIGRGWLERLSGPGPFQGKTFDARILCFAAPVKETQAIVTAFQEHPRPARFIFPRDEKASAWFTPLFGCHFQERDQPRLELGVEYSRLHSVNNLLDYSSRPDVTESGKKVNLHILLLTADLRVNRILDVGVGIGRGWFGSPDDLFRDFSRLVTQPVRLTTRPLAVFSPSKRVEAILVQFDGRRFKGAFTAEDFGARPGTYSERGEIVWTWSVKADLRALFW